MRVPFFPCDKILPLGNNALIEKARVVLERPKNNQYPISFSEDLTLATTKNSISLYGQLDDVRTRNISEIETVIEANVCKKSTIVRDTRIELVPTACPVRNRECLCEIPGLNRCSLLGKQVYCHYTNPACC